MCIYIYIHMVYIYIYIYTYAATALGVARRRPGQAARRGLLLCACWSQQHEACVFPTYTTNNLHNSYSLIAAREGTQHEAASPRPRGGRQPGAAEGLYIEGRGPRSLTQGSSAKCLSRLLVCCLLIVVLCLFV